AGRLRGGVVVRAPGGDAGEMEVRARLAAGVRRALALALDLAPFHRLCRRDPLLRRVAALGAGRLLRGTSFFEDVVAAVAAGGSSGAATARIAGLGRRGPAAPPQRALPPPPGLAPMAGSPPARPAAPAPARLG